MQEISFKETHENKDFRTDSDFWTKEPYKNSKLEYAKIRDHLKKAQYGISISMNEEGDGVPIYRMNEIHNMLCDLTVLKHASLNEVEKSNFDLKDGDVLFNRTNSYEWVGRTGVYYKQDSQDYVFASYLVRFIPDQNTILPEYLSAYLNTKFGVQDIKRRSRQSINQTNVNPEEVKEIEIPLLSMAVQQLIKHCFVKANTKRASSDRYYKQAENILLDELKLSEFKLSDEAVNIKSFSESFGASGRIDAEYYQPKYDDYLSLIYDYSEGHERLVPLCNLRDKKFLLKDDKEYCYIELSNIGKSGNIIGCTHALGSELPSRARRTVKTGDLLVSSIEGSLDSCALVTEEYSDALCSTGFYVINSDKVNSECLMVLFKSDIMQAILKQRCSGTILTAINKDEFIDIPIPIIDTDRQEDIKKAVHESFKLRYKSEKLLDVAKRAVEIAIEEDEGTAEAYIKNECTALGVALEDHPTS